ncbi:MAG: T9SS type A sorting domain-containing protein, partial [Bacteroidaceae bacterium]|nr:T9SS type A sorting domain-containing protein [Bacteroidaceae bacterium]
GDWNTYLLTLMGDKWSLMWTQSAAKNGAQFLVVTGDRMEAKSIARSESYTVSIVRKGDETSIGSIEENRRITISDGRIAAPEGTQSIEIYSADGRLLKRSIGNVISAAGLQKGVYIAVAITCNSAESYKIAIE